MHPGGEFLSFQLGDEEYGIEIVQVQEIRSYAAPTRLANAAGYIKGLVNLRGVIVPILDLRLKFSLSSAEYNDFTVVIVLGVAGRTIGVVVDVVSDVLQLEPAQIRRMPVIWALSTAPISPASAQSATSGPLRISMPSSRVC